MDNLNGVGEGINAGNASWTFGDNTPKNFDEHVRRSVPFYDAGHELVVEISDFFVKPDSTCYELGASTATLIKLLAKRHKPSVRWIGIDIEPVMIEQAQKELGKEKERLDNVDLVVDDISLYGYSPSDFIVSYYTLQFVPPRLRQELLNKIYKTLNWGGAFLMFEKVRGPDARFQDMMTSLYTDYKLKQSYSSEEIIAKSRSLKGILEPFSTQGNIDLLKRAGFVDVVTVFKYICFEGFLCIK